jgi:uncharacterized protein with HEPN domain
MPPDDIVRLRHMLDAAQEATAFVIGKSRAHLDSERMLCLALVRLVEIIGEAAANVSADTCTAYPDIPWSKIVGTRNRLIHAYYSINLDVLWGTIESDLPPLIATLTTILHHPHSS